MNIVLCIVAGSLYLSLGYGLGIVSQRVFFNGTSNSELSWQGRALRLILCPLNYFKWSEKDAFIVDTKYYLQKMAFLWPVKLPTITAGIFITILWALYQIPNTLFKLLDWLRSSRAKVVVAKVKTELQLVEEEIQTILGEVGEKRHSISLLLSSMERELDQNPDLDKLYKTLCSSRDHLEAVSKELENRIADMESLKCQINRKKRFLGYCEKIEALGLGGISTGSEASVGELRMRALDAIASLESTYRETLRQTRSLEIKKMTEMPIFPLDEVSQRVSHDDRESLLN